jgi:hypothetical protein
MKNWTDEQLKNFVLVQKKLVAEQQSEIARAEKEIKDRLKIDRRKHDPYRQTVS